jgi:hypothetical protein
MDMAARILNEELLDTTSRIWKLLAYASESETIPANAQNHKVDSIY